MKETAFSLAGVLANFTTITTWFIGVFVDVMEIFINSPLIIPIGIGVTLLALAVGWRYLSSIAGGGRRA